MRLFIKNMFCGIISICMVLSLCSCGVNKYENYIDHEYAKENNAYYVSIMDRNYYSYSKGYQADKEVENVYSVAKLYTAIAIGMCVDRQLLDVADKFVDVMDITLKVGQDAKWNNVTIEMLLMHKVGFATGLLDVDVDDVEGYGTTNYLEYVLNTPLPNIQGEDYQYTDASYYLLSLVVEKVMGNKISEVLRYALVDSMHYSAYKWQECPMGHTMGATGLYIKSKDMVKLGVLLLNKGEWKGVRIISKQWCDYLITQQISISPKGNGWYAKGGMYGQQLAINFDKDIALAVTAYSKTLSLNKLIKQ